MAASLAALVLDLERAGHSRDVVEKFVMRCIFTMSAEDIGLLRDDVFKSALRHRPQTTSRKVSDRNRLQSPISDIELRS